MEWLQWTKNNIKRLLWFYICFLCQIPQAHQSPQLGWWALELLCCSYHPKDLVFEDRQTMPKEWRRASEWSNLGDETNACLVLFKCLCKLIFHSCVQNVKFQMYIVVGNRLTELDECWPAYLLRHFMEPWDFRKQTHGWETAEKTKRLIAAVDESMQRFTHTIISVRLSAIYDIWKRQYDCLTWCNYSLAFNKRTLPNCG